LKTRILYILLGLMPLSVEGVGQVVITPNYSTTYNGFPTQPPFTITGCCGEVKLFTDNSTGNSIGANAPINAGSYKLRITFTFGPNNTFFDEQNFTIIKATPTITATGATTYTYNGTPQGPGTSTYPADATGADAYSYSGAASDGTVYSASGTKPTNAGSYQVVASIASDLNYNSASSVPTSFIINKKPLTITIDASDKVYDGITYANPTITSDKLGYDNIDIFSSSAFNNKNIGIGKVVTTSITSITGIDAGNYSLTSATATGTASITVKSLTITPTATDKQYDGNATATATLTDSRISGDVFTVNKISATFNNKNIGTGKAVTVSGISLTGTDAGNYTLTSTTATGTASITVKSLTITPTVTDKQYDGNTTAAATLTDSRISGDVFTVNKTSTTFNNKNVGVAKTVTVSGITITGTDAGNYTLTSTTAAGTASITVRSLTISATASDKEYDGNTTANATLTDNRITGDVFTVDKTGATFNNKNIGTGRAVTVSGISLTGTDAGNYSLTSTTATGTASITVKSLTISATASDKVYDGTNTANVTLTDSRITGDVFTVDKTGATFNNKNIGTGKAVSVAGITLTGADAGNYTLTSSTATGTASITVKSLTITPTATDKEYDGNTTATATLTDNRITDDDFTVNKTSATFNNKNVGTGKAVTVSGITLTGSDAGNYTLTSTTATGTASITVKSLTITPTATDKEYDGNTTATATLTDSRISGDVFTVNKTSATFNNKNIGVRKAVTVSGISLTGSDAGNYTLTSATAAGSASITVKSLTISATASDKIYDGNNNATINLVDNRVSGDILTVNKVGATFNDKNVGSGKTVNVSGINLTGIDAGNYSLINTTTTGTASITSRNLIITAIGKNKPYDGNRKAEVALTENKISGDNITTSYILAEFDTPEVGDNKLVTVSGISIGGVDVGNYNLTSSNVTTNASITAPTTIIFEIPNAFTPNGDGMNDELKIISNAGVRSLTSFKIFSRSGNLVFESRDLTRGWDGRYNGNLLPADIYYWTAVYVDRNNVTNPKNGTVLLLK
jgi:gliding motility-associated-like protein